MKQPFFSPLDVVNVKISPYGINGILGHYHHRYDTKLGQVVVADRIIPCGCHYFSTQLSFP